MTLIPTDGILGNLQDVNVLLNLLLVFGQRERNARGKILTSDETSIDVSYDFSFDKKDIILCLRPTAPTSMNMSA